MASVCQAPIQGTTMRVQAVDSCGTPKTGSCVSATSTGFVSVEMEDQVENGQEIVVLNAAGVMCVNEKSPKQLKWSDVTITFCKVDPELFNLLTGSTLVLDDSVAPQAVGFQTRTSNYATGEFALEVWTNIAQATCVTVGTYSLVPYGYFLLPHVVEGTVGNLKIENGAVSFTVAGRTKQGTNWGTGPKNVLANMTTGAAEKLLTALPSDTHRHVQWTYLAPPAASCGCTS